MPLRTATRVNLPRRPTTTMARTGDAAPAFGTLMLFCVFVEMGGDTARRRSCALLLTRLLELHARRASAPKEDGTTEEVWLMPMGGEGATATVARQQSSRLIHRFHRARKDFIIFFPPSGVEEPPLSMSLTPQL